jgi:hypothetical protein
MGEKLNTETYSLRPPCEGEDMESSFSFLMTDTVSGRGVASGVETVEPWSLLPSLMRILNPEPSAVFLNKTKQTKNNNKFNGMKLFNSLYTLYYFLDIFKSQPILPI